jgi:hypothetical protein
MITTIRLTQTNEMTSKLEDKDPKNSLLGFRFNLTSEKASRKPKKIKDEAEPLSPDSKGSLI